MRVRLVALAHIEDRVQNERPALGPFRILNAYRGMHVKLAMITWLRAESVTASWPAATAVGSIEHGRGCFL
jgi:hypothetical protein